MEEFPSYHSFKFNGIGSTRTQVNSYPILFVRCFDKFYLFFFQEDQLVKV